LNFDLCAVYFYILSVVKRSLGTIGQFEPNKGIVRIRFVLSVQFDGLNFAKNKKMRVHYLFGDPFRQIANP